MNDPIFRDAVEDEENIDLGEVYQYLESQGKTVKNEVVDIEAERMVEEIVELSIAEEVERFPWRAPCLSFGLDNRYSRSNILDLDYSDGSPSIIARIAREAADIVQFPGNTAYLHGIGAFSSACVVNFEVEYNDGFIPAGMYTLAAQPSGSGKSAINNFYTKPIERALTMRNRLLYVLHKNIDSELEAFDKKIEQAKSDPGLLQEYAKAMSALNEDKLRKPLVRPARKNVTPQAAEQEAAMQGGVINVVSDEAEGLDVYLGLAYTDGKSNPDNGVFIAAFGGDRLATARVGRKGIDVPVRGAFAVIAQNASIDTMIKAGAAGRGVSERCLIIKEPNKIGWRKYSRERRTIDIGLQDEYLALCENVLNGSFPLQLKFSEECRDMIVDLKNSVEPQCRPGSKYGDDQIRGFASKIEQHITKLAAVFHIAEQWNPKVTARPRFEIQSHNLIKSMKVCMDLLDSYCTLIESASESGGSKLVLEVVALMKRYAVKGLKSFTVDKMRMAVSKEAWYMAIDGRKIDYLVNLLLRCEEMNFCHVKEGGPDKKKWHVLINPALKDFLVKGEE